MEGYKCDECGLPATNYGRDFVQQEPIEGVTAEVWQAGDLRCGCDLHPVIVDDLPFEGEEE
jgi:hypothetical protein